MAESVKHEDANNYNVIKLITAKSDVNGDIRCPNNLDQYIHSLADGDIEVEFHLRDQSLDDNLKALVYDSAGNSTSAIYIDKEFDQLTYLVYAGKIRIKSSAIGGEFYFELDNSAGNTVASSHSGQKFEVVEDLDSCTDSKSEKQQS